MGKIEDGQPAKAYLQDVIMNKNMCITRQSDGRAKKYKVTIEEVLD